MSRTPNKFLSRHIGPQDKDIESMLDYIGFDSLNDLVQSVIPENILSLYQSKIPTALSETQAIAELHKYSKNNNVFKSLIGMGYYGTVTPTVIQRNILENPGWYTQYTPYQAEISQGRLEALLNFQTMISDLTGLPLANASLLDEGTSAAEAMLMFFNATRDSSKNTFLVSDKCHPQTIDVLKTRSEPLGIQLTITDHANFNFNESIFGALIQYPDTEGSIQDFSVMCNSAHENKSYVCMVTDLLALTLLKPPGEMDADAAVGNAQRFGVSLGFGGPHAAFFATSDKFKRKIPGRIIGVSRDSHGDSALRMALQTREQHIRREKATSNICTSQVLLAIMSGMYAVYHGPQGLKNIAERVYGLTNLLASSLSKAGYVLHHKCFFDTIRFSTTENWQKKALAVEINLRDYGDETVGIAIDETTTLEDIDDILNIFNASRSKSKNNYIPNNLKRQSSYLQHPVFNQYHSESAMLRYLHQLEMKDLSLNTSMIPLGSCTMKLNATSEMVPVTWPEFSGIHPFVPSEQTNGYYSLIHQLGDWLVELTGFDNFSMQPNSGSQGEYTGLLIIKAYHEAKGDHHRNVCLIPSSAHGTNPASAVMAGMKVVILKSDDSGNIDQDDLRFKATEHSNNLAAIMVTYPSTHGVFEETIRDTCQIVHQHGGQVYIDGANLNAMVGLCRPGKFGGDVMHINLHKTFCIPHGGGGPGMGPIVCMNHLTPYLPGHFHINSSKEHAIHAVASAPYGSSSILTISWAYIAMMSTNGLQRATQVAILNANYMAKRLEDCFPILYRGKNGLNAHEFIVDLRPIKQSSGISEEDVAKRLMDYGFHAPTMSWPVSGTMMIEPTESETKEELDRFCDAMISIKHEIMNVEKGEVDPHDNPLKNAPHTAKHIASDNWNHPYSRQQAAYPADWLKDYKYWPPVGRVDNAFGDRNLVCTCPSPEYYIEP